MPGVHPQDVARGGGSPWWTNHVVGGYPLVADPLSALFYPPNLLMHLAVRREFPPCLALEGQLALHFLWAALGMYAVARVLTGSRAGAIIAALSWAFGSFFVWHLPHLIPISTLSWLPWILFAYYKAITTRSLVWVGSAALASAMPLLAGHPLSMLQIVYLGVGIALVVAWQQWRRDRRTAVGTLLITVTVIGLGAALAMIQLLPSWHLSGQTDRADFSYAAASSSSFAPHWIPTLVLPNFFAPEGPAAYWAMGDSAETNLYMGMLPLALAILGVTRARGIERRITLFILAGALIAFPLALGSFAWPSRFAYELFPGFDRVRRPGNYIVFVQFALALLAAYGVKALSWPNAGRQVWCLRAGWLRRALLLLGGVGVLVATGLAATVGSPNHPP